MSSIACPHCGAKLKVKAELAGRTVACPACRKPVTVPAASRHAALTSRCPGCGRDIPLRGTHELSLTLECAKCSTRFVPAGGNPAGPSPVTALPPADPLPPDPAPQRRGLLVALALAGGLVVGCCAGGGGGFLAGRFSTPGPDQVIPAAAGAAPPGKAAGSEVKPATTGSPAFQPPKVEHPDQTVTYLRQCLFLGRMNRERGFDNAPVEARLQKIPDLPALRTFCREQFRTEEVTESTVDTLADWLCTTFDLKQDQANAMSLEEVAARIKYYKGRKK
jgi:hypothetical protein